ncbi:hypothetical protein [Nonomuraea sp. KM88]
MVGWEAQIALRDVRGLDPQAEQGPSSGAARSLVTAAIKDHEATLLSG